MADHERYDDQHMTSDNKEYNAQQHDEVRKYIGEYNEFVGYIRCAANRKAPRETDAPAEAWTMAVFEEIPKLKKAGVGFEAEQNNFNNGLPRRIAWLLGSMLASGVAPLDFHRGQAWQQVQQQARVFWYTTSTWIIGRIQVLYKFIFKNAERRDHVADAPYYAFGGVGRRRRREEAVLIQLANIWRWRRSRRPYSSTSASRTRSRASTMRCWARLLQARSTLLEKL